MKKNSDSGILKREFKEQHLNTVPKSCSFIYNIICLFSYKIYLYRREIEFLYL